MIRLQINPAFVDLLRSCNLHNYPQIMQTSLGTVVEEKSLRDVRCLSFDGTRLYLKQTREEKTTSSLQSYCHR
jgi:hypothetical protein